MSEQPKKPKKDKPVSQPFEATLQDLVYSVDSGGGLGFFRIFVFCLFVFAVGAIFTANRFDGLNSEASMDYAQLGRNLAERNQYVTQCVRPVSIAKVSERNSGDAKLDEHPELFKAPLYPAILAGAFKILAKIDVKLFPDSEDFEGKYIYPAEELVIVPLNHLFVVLTGLFVYLLGRRLFSNQIGLLGTVTYFLSQVVWQDSLSGVGLPIATFFVLGAAYFSLISMTNRMERKSVWVWFPLFILSIIFSAAAFLTYYSSIAVIIGLALFIGITGSKVQRGGYLAFSYLLLVILFVSPWLMRNIQLSGSPLGLAPYTVLMDSVKYPDDTWMRSLDYEFDPVAAFMVAKGQWVANFTALFKRGFIPIGSGVLMALFIVTFFYHFVRVPVYALKWGVGLGIVLFHIGTAFFGSEVSPLYHVFWPFIILYGLAFFFIFLDRLNLSMDFYKSALTILVVALTALPLGVTIFLSKTKEMTYPPYYVPFIMRVSEYIKPTEVMCTDIPWATAWYGRRNSILVPETVESFYDLNDYNKYVSGMYFTSLTTDRSFSSFAGGLNKSWFTILTGNFPGMFPLKYGFALGMQKEQLFLSDTTRWDDSEVRGGSSDEDE